MRIGQSMREKMMMNMLIYEEQLKVLKDRRPEHAVKAFNAQVQSVSINRAMESSIKSSQLKKGWGCRVNQW